MSLLGCCIGFLIYNFYPSKIFMGDSGSYFLGFALASLSLLTFTNFDNESTNYITSLNKSFFLLFVPIMDMIIVVFQRLLKGKSPFFPDRSHLHFRILDSGKSTLATVSIIYFFTLLFTFSSLIV